MQKYFNNVTNRTGDVVPGAIVTVTLAATGALATIYSDNGVTPRANPITCDNNGYFSFYAADGLYTLTINGSGIQTQTITDVLVEDRIDLAASSGSSLVGFLQAGTGATPRTVQDKARESVSVEDFTGADDYAKVQAALNHLNTLGGGVLKAPGTYSLSAQPRTYSNITIDMCGTGTLRRDFNTSATGASLLGVTTGSSGVAVINGTLDGNGDAFSDQFDIVYGSTCSDLLFENVTFLDVSGGHAIDFWNTKRLRAVGCKFLGYADKTGTRNFSEAIQIDPGIGLANPVNEDWVIEGCYFGANPDNTDPDFGPWAAGVGNHASTDNSIVRRITIRDCTFDGMTYAGIRPYAWEQATFAGNKFIDCEREIYAAVYTGTVPRGNADIAISNNIFAGSVSNGIFFEDASAGVTPTVGLTVTGNAFKNASTALRLQSVTDFAIAGNKCKTALTFVNLLRSSIGTVAGNSISGTTSTGIYLGSTASNDVAITGNTFHNLVATRAVHVNIAAKGITIADNLVVDCSGVAAFAADSAAENVAIRDNTIRSGSLGLVPSGNAIVTSSSVVNPQVTNNQLGSGVPQVSVAASAAGGIFIGACTGTPEAAIVAPIGSMALRKDGGAGTSLYVKQSGTGNTGWVGK